MKVLNIPEFTWEAGKLTILVCPQCSGKSVHVSSLPSHPSKPSFLEVPHPSKERYAIYVRDYRSRSGKSYCEPRSGGLPTCRGRAQHGKVFMTRGGLHVHPTELGMERCFFLARIRDLFDGVRGEYTLTVDSEVTDPVEVPEAAWLCQECKAKRMAEEGTRIQGNLWALRVSEEGLGQWCFPQKQETVGRFFNHRLEGGKNGGKNFISAGRWAVVNLLQAAKVVSPNHEAVELEPGIWLFYHPWPKWGRD